MRRDSSQNATVLRERALRPEIQALRALAVTLVVGYHLGPQLLPGGYIGVDVFFVISGYLMTAHLLRELQATGRIRLWRFYARRIRRLLPAALLVLLATLVGTLSFVPTTLWGEIGKQLAASAFYVENWALAGNATVYSASDGSSSPVQHFWSLSVEEQFYLVWPVLMVGVAVLARRLGRPSRGPLLTAVVMVTTLSFVFSVAATTFSPAAAYFITPTRIWELGLGGLLALVGIKAPLSDALRSLMALGGIGAVLIGTFAFSSTTPFPGFAALLPVIATAAVIVAGNASKQGSLSRLMSLKPLQYLGDISYSLYLWHWPLIVIVPFAAGGGFRPPLRIAVLIASLVLAAATKRFVEDRFRIGPPIGPSWQPTLRAYGWVAAGVVLVAVPALLVSASARSQVSAAVAQLAVDRVRPPAGLGAPGISDPTVGAHLIPSPLAALADTLDTDSSGTVCDQGGLFVGVPKCHFGSASSAHQVAVVGDSHMGQWLPAIVALAHAHGWGVTTYLRTGCPLSTTYTTRATNDGHACIRWVAAALDELKRHRYERVFVSAFSGSSYVSPSGAAGVSQGMAAAWRQVTATGSPVVVFRDNPVAQAAGVADVPTCVQRHQAKPSACDLPRLQSLLPDPQVDAAALTPGARVIDLTRFFCPVECPAVIGGALVYRDGNHLTRTYVNSLVPAIDHELSAPPS